MKILTTPDPHLRRVAEPVTIWDKKMDQLVKEMIDILMKAKDPEGVGLAATQLGINKRFFILRLDPDKPEIFINPKILSTSKKNLSDKYKNPKKRFLEGCLSLPNLWGFVDRPLEIVVEYQTPSGITKKETFKNEESSYFLHEYDHLDGILFTDRILEQGGTILVETSSGLAPLNQ